jgi:TetR/AcrR family transcriptional regulator
VARRNSVETRARILDAAERIFSEVGFDGSRVDEIARVADVNKALIYHYFPGKDALLETLFSRLIDDARQMIAATAEGLPELGGPEGYRPLFDVFVGFVTARRGILRVAVAESAKVSSGASIVMELGRLLLAAEMADFRRNYEARGLWFPEDQQELLVMEFFTGLMPYLTYALYRDQWIEHYGVSEPDLREAFYRAFQRTHVAAHAEMLAALPVHGASPGAV